MPETSKVDFPWLTHDSLEEIRGEPVLVRVDFNVPLSEDGSVTDTRRLDAALPTIRDLLGVGANPVLMSHLGRPEGREQAELSLEPLVELLEERLKSPVNFASDCIGPEASSTVTSLEEGEVALLENLRFHPGEKDNDDSFVSELASLADVYVNNAFGTAHRAHASIVGVPARVDQAAAGQLMKEEYVTLTSLREHPERPFSVLLGGAKVADKLPLIRVLLEVADSVLIGGAMAHTFFRAMGYGVGDSLVEEDSVEEASQLLEEEKDYPGELVLAKDVRAENYARSVNVYERDSIPEGWNSKDIGPETIELFIDHLTDASTVFWNGPMGVFEEDAFEEGTRDIVEALAEHTGKVVVGGGDSGAAVAKYSDLDRFYHVSTGGGAALELVEGRSLPGFEALDRPVAVS